MHPIKKPATFKLNRPHVAVMVECIGKKLKLVNQKITVLKPDTDYAYIPKDFLIVGLDGEQIEPSGRFAITTATISPYHMVIDITQ